MVMAHPKFSTPETSPAWKTAEGTRSTSPASALLIFQHNPYSYSCARQLVRTESGTSSASDTTHTSSPTTSVAGSLRGSEFGQSHTAFPLLPTKEVVDVPLYVRGGSLPFAALITAPPMIGTLHASLAASHVPFVPYPSVAATMAAQEMLSPETPPFTDRAVTSQFNETDCEALLQEEEGEAAEDVQIAAHEAQALAKRKRCGFRLFLGQLPMYVTGDQVAWIVETVTGRRVFGTEAIHSWGKGGGPAAPGGAAARGRPRSPTKNQQQQRKGCVHTYCDTEDDAQCIVELLGNRSRVLVDDTGIFIATTDAQQFALFSYCEEMAKDVHKRFPLRPFRPVVAQRATSTFVPVTITEFTPTVGMKSLEQPGVGGPTIVAGPGGAVVQAPPPYYSCAVERLRQEATLPRQADTPPPQMVTIVPYDVNAVAPAPSYRRGRT